MEEISGYEQDKCIKQEKERLAREWKQLEDRQRLFDQKLEILKESYIQLDADRRKLEREKLQFEAQKEHMNHSYASARNQSMAVSLFFKGVTSPLALKKRYRDLIKIFHPDNLCGDKETLQMINQEYEILLRELENFREA
ncbi:MAG: hypothetical protein ACI4SE_02615 [Lachnospiraceae bacterium]